MNILFLGTNSMFKSRIRMLPVAAESIVFLANYKDAVRVSGQFPTDGGNVLLYEMTTVGEDITAITYLRSKMPEAYLILVADSIGDKERTAYLSCGINDTIPLGISTEDLLKKLDFIERKKDILFTRNTKKKQILHFKIPMWKRVFDIVFSIFSLIILSPVFLITALAIKLETGGPIWYRSKRVGSNYQIFDFLKFRSMYVDADKRLKEFEELNKYKEDEDELPDQLSSGNIPGEDEVMLISDDFIIPEHELKGDKIREQKNAFVKLDKDPRITKVGRFIRKYSIDELPQLFNILKGEMSVVGNRPLPLYEAELLTSDEYIDRFIAPAGLTGLWQVKKHGDSGKLSAEERKQLDIIYGQTYSFALDMKIIMMTLTAFIQRDE